MDDFYFTILYVESVKLLDASISKMWDQDSDLK